jgi:hypothetical protein
MLGSSVIVGETSSWEREFEFECSRGRARQELRSLGRGGLRVVVLGVLAEGD